MNTTNPSMNLVDLRCSLVNSDDARLQKWTSLDARKRWFELLAFAAIYLCGAALMVWSRSFAGIAGGLCAVAGIVLMGISYNSLGLFLHEGLHGALAKSRGTNRWASFAVGAPLLISATAYRLTHTLHHLELGRVRDFGTYRQHTRSNAVVWICYYLQLFAGSLIYILCIPFLAWRHGRRGVRRRIILEYAIIAAVACVVLAVVPGGVILRYWFLPILVMNVLTNIRGLASHALGDQNDALLASRSLRTHPIVEWLLLYENLHLVHHLFPKVPSYRLREVHEAVWGHLPRACWNKSYSAFLWAFFKASLRGELQPLGVVAPKEEMK